MWLDQALTSTLKYLVIKVYVYIFARPSMQYLNDAILNLALHGRGYNNAWDLKSTGEELFLKLLSKYNPKLCIDIGANKGHYSEMLLRLTKSKVIAFEPLPNAFSILAKLQTTYPNRLIAINEGVGDKNAKLDLHFGEISSLASFSAEVNQIDYVGRNNTNTMQVNVTTLDNYFTTRNEQEFAEIDLLKIDTEGYEYEVLLGAKNTIIQKKPKFIQIEYNLHQLFISQSLFKLASLLPNYVPYQLLPHGSGLSKRDTKRPEANIYHFSNFVFVRSDISI